MYERDDRRMVRVWDRCDELLVQSSDDFPHVHRWCVPANDGLEFARRALLAVEQRKQDGPGLVVEAFERQSHAIGRVRRLVR